LQRRVEDGVQKKIAEFKAAKTQWFSPRDNRRVQGWPSGSAPNITSQVCQPKKFWLTVHS
jgi:hypothetical protein